MAAGRPGPGAQPGVGHCGPCGSGGATLCVEEYGREFSEIRPGGFTAPWRSDEFDLVVDRQIQLEQAALRRMPKPLLRCDTDLLATALWHERYVGESAQRVLERAAAHQPALCILTGDEIPFVRDGEHIRHSMQERFREALEGQSVPWIEVRGGLTARVIASTPWSPTSPPRVR